MPRAAAYSFFPFYLPSRYGVSSRVMIFRMYHSHLILTRQFARIIHYNVVTLFYFPYCVFHSVYTVSHQYHHYRLVHLNMPRKTRTHKINTTKNETVKFTHVSLRPGRSKKVQATRIATNTRRPSPPLPPSPPSPQEPVRDVVEDAIGDDEVGEEDWEDEDEPREPSRVCTSFFIPIPSC